MKLQRFSMSTAIATIALAFGAAHAVNDGTRTNATTAQSQSASTMPTLPARPGSKLWIAPGTETNVVNCGLGRTCSDGEKCCIVGVGHWCCPKSKSCDYDRPGDCK